MTSLLEIEVRTLLFRLVTWTAAFSCVYTTLVSKLCLADMCFEKVSIFAKATFWHIVKEYWNRLNWKGTDTISITIKDKQMNEYRHDNLSVFLHSPRVIFACSTRWRHLCTKRVFLFSNVWLQTSHFSNGSLFLPSLSWPAAFLFVWIYRRNDCSCWICCHVMISTTRMMKPTRRSYYLWYRLTKLFNV